MAATKKPTRPHQRQENNPDKAGWEHIRPGAAIMFHNATTSWPFTVLHIFVRYDEFATALDALNAVYGRANQVTIMTNTLIKIPLSKCSYSGPIQK